MRMDDLILGDNPFFGINHRAERQASEKSKRFDNVQNIVDVMKIARQNGAGGVMLTSHEKTAGIVRQMIKEPELVSFHVYPHIPYIMKYVREVTRSGLVGTFANLVSGDSGLGNLRHMIAGGLGILQKDFHALVKSAIDMEMTIYKGAQVKAIFLHNGIVDLALGLGMDDVFLFFDSYIRQRYSALPGFGTLNLVRLVKRLNDCGLKNPLVMASFNAKGFYMNPSQAECETIVKKNSFTLLAMNTLAQGALDPETAFRYLSRFGVQRAIIGASTEKHIEESFRAAKDFL